MEKVGILGGTFDPIHKGHIYLAKTAMEKCSLNRVMFLPLNVPPHKPAPIADSITRFNMVQQAIKAYGNFFISDMEIKRVGTTYTVDTLSELKAIYKDWDIHYIIGTDTLYDLEKWRNIKEVFSLCTFICMSRPGQDNNAQREYADMLEKKYDGKIVIIETMGFDISSTMIRNSKEKLDTLVPDEIIDDVKKIYVKD